MEFVKTNLEFVKEYVIAAQAFAWSHKLEIGATLYALLPSFWGRRFWLNSQMYILLVISGLPTLICPQTYMSYMSVTSDKMDETHIQLMRWIGILIITQALSCWLLSKSSDSTTETSQLWAYTVESGCVVMAKFYMYIYPPKKTGVKFDEQMFPSSILATTLMFLVSLFYALRSTDWGGYTEQLSRRNTHIRLDFLFLFVFGVMWFVSPSLFLNCQTDAETTDVFHLYQCRVVGAYVFYNAILSARSVTFLRDSDKDAVIFSHLIGYVMLITVFAVGQIKNWETMSLKSAALMSVDEIFLVFNSVVAMSVDVPKYLTKTLVPRVMQVPQDLKRFVKRKRF
ncbi:hypothetical protein CHS0354_013577 [Potamilus streckersoni]|uniref:Uncharacterized protein n=1 Tax=Potamilus streckersoni TaxID=2493646 RepID=A0AAE0SLE1_9BIVA|nr:hypothetical protein CHS0354_013577 [Potamilus streckersoni]